MSSPNVRSFSMHDASSQPKHPSTNRPSPGGLRVLVAG